MPSEAEVLRPTPVESRPVPETDPTLADRTIKLTKKVMAHGELIDKIVFREPTGGDIEKCGNPVTYDFSGGGSDATPKIDEKKMAAMMVELAAVPPSTIKALHPRDWTAFQWRLFPFFLPAAGT